MWRNILGFSGKLVGLSTSSMNDRSRTETGLGCSFLSLTSSETPGLIMLIGLDEETSNEDPRSGLLEGES